MSETVILKTSCERGAAMFEYTFEGHLQRIQNCLHTQWLQGLFCDLEIQTCEGSIRAHTCLLAAFSPKIAAVLSFNHSDCYLNTNKLWNPFSLDIMFNHDIVKTIVEAIYSGFLTAPLGSLDELEAALKWLEMHELLEVVKCIHDQSKKENLITTPDIKPPEAVSIKVGRRKSLRKPRKTISFSKATNVDPSSNSLNLVSFINDVPIAVSLTQKDSKTLQCEFKTINDSMLLGEDDGMFKFMNYSSPIMPLSHENAPDNFVSADDVDAQGINSGSKTGIKKPTKQEKSKRKQKKPSKSSPTKITKKHKKVECRRQVKSEGRNKSYVKNASSFETALENQFSEVIEGEEEKKKQATEALTCKGSNIVKEEPPDAEEFGPCALEDEALFTCDKCKSTFFNVDEYESHIKNHPTFTCENCFMVFYSRTLLCRHIRSSHLKSMHLKCNYCEFTATDHKLFEEHSMEVHQEVQPFKCLFEGCNYKTSKYRYLTRHFQKHENFRSCVCEKCHKIFEHYSNLNSHRRSCYKVQMYLCDICGQSFNHHTSMKIHRHTMHFGEKPYQCKECQKCFSNGANLRRHMRIHNNSYPYSCNICMKQFRHSNTMKLHMSKHKETENPKPVTMRSEREAIFPPNPSVNPQPHSSIQLWGAAPSQAFIMPVMTMNNNQHAASVSHYSTATSLPYGNQSPWHESNSYRFPSPLFMRGNTSLHFHD